MSIGGSSKSIMRIAREHAQTLPSPEALERFGTYNMLALIHDSICHLVPPVGQLAKVLPALEQIVNSLAEQQATLTEILSIQKDSALARKATDKFDGVFSLSHSVLDRRLRFVSANESYEHMFAFSCTQLKGLALLEVVHASDVPHLSKVTKLLLKGTIAACEVIEWRATGTGRFVLTRDTLWGIGTSGVRGPEFISMVSEKVVEQNRSARFVKDTRSINLGRCEK